MRWVLQKISDKHGRAHFCGDSGSTGYGLYHQVTTIGHPCAVFAPSLPLRKLSDRVKTNRRKVIALTKLLRAGALASVWGPDEVHEAMRDLYLSSSARFAREA